MDLASLGSVAIRRMGTVHRIINDVRSKIIAANQIDPLSNEELSNVLATAIEPVVAFDIFDTIVERSVKPEHVKILAADRLVRRLGLDAIDGMALYELRRQLEAKLCRENAAAHGELEFRFADLARAIHARLTEIRVLSATFAVETFQSAMLTTELTVEREMLVAKPGFPTLIAGLVVEGKRIVFISDFYLPETALRALLNHLDLMADGVRCFVSCDYLASKRSGRLYDILLRSLNCAASDVLMIGDNPHSDVAMARRHGIHAELIDNRERLAFYKSAIADVTKADRRNARIASVVAGQSATLATTLRAAVPALLHFIELLFSETRKRRLRHLFFLAREGRLLEQMFNIYQDALGLADNERVQTHYVLISRRAAFIASLAPLDQETFAEFFILYRSISLRDFMRSLRFDESLIVDLAERIDGDPDVVEPNFPTSAGFRALIADPLFRESYEAIRLRQKANLRAYLDQFGVDLNEHGLTVVDVGWKGTIQDCVRKILPEEIRVSGLYLGLIGVGQSLADKTGLLLCNVGGLTRDYLVYAENRSLFEILLCAEHDSVLGYETRSDGRVAATFDAAADEMDFLRRDVMPVAEDALVAFAEMVAVRLAVATTEDNWRDFVARMHADLVFEPWRPDAAWLATVRHRENFGVFKMSTFGDQRPLSLAERVTFLKSLARDPRRIIHGSFWPSYTFYRNGGRPLAKAYRWWRMRSNRRANRRIPSVGVAL